MREHEFYIIADILEEVALDFTRWLNALADGVDAYITILSHGGLCFVGTGMGQMILEARSRGIRFTADVYGICASAASDIALACDRIRMARGSQLMIHSAYNAFLDTVDEGILRANESQLNIIHLHFPDYSEKDLKEDKWINADEAVSLGLAEYIDNNDESVSLARARVAACYGMRKGVTMEETKVKAEETSVTFTQEAPEKKEEEAPAKAEDRSMEDVMEAVVNRLDEIEHRLAVLEGEGKKQDDEMAECGSNDEKRALLNSLYARLLRPTASAVKQSDDNAPEAHSQQVEELADFSKRVNVSDYIR